MAKSKGAAKKERKPDPAELDRQLDEALKATFPASDPVAVGHTTGTEASRPEHRRPAAIDKALVDRLAKKVG